VVVEHIMKDILQDPDVEIDPEQVVKTTEGVADSKKKALYGVLKRLEW